MYKLSLKYTGLFHNCVLFTHCTVIKMRQKAIADGAVEPQKALTDGTQEPKQDLTDSNETKNHEQASPLKPRALLDVGLTEPKVGLTEQQAIVEKAMEARSEAKGEKKTSKPGKTTKDVKKEEKTEKKAKSEKTEPNEKSGLKMDRKNCHSRAYHRALKVFEQKGYSHEKAKEKAAAEASKELQKLGNRDGRQDDTKEASQQEEIVLGIEVKEKKCQFRPMLHHPYRETGNGIYLH